MSLYTSSEAGLISCDLESIVSELNEHSGHQHIKSSMGSKRASWLSRLKAQTYTFWPVVSAPWMCLAETCGAGLWSLARRCKDEILTGAVRHSEQII